jgi:hypothetical protein
MTATLEGRPAPSQSPSPPKARAKALTTIEISSKARAELANIAEEDFCVASLDKNIWKLIMEHHFAMINARYDELRADPVEWADYQAELRLTDQAAGDGLGDTREEYPEYNQ